MGGAWNCWSCARNCCPSATPLGTVRSYNWPSCVIWIESPALLPTGHVTETFWATTCALAAGVALAGAISGVMETGGCTCGCGAGCGCFARSLTVMFLFRQ